jgi:hypothetical protein
MSAVVRRLALFVVCLASCATGTQNADDGSLDGGGFLPDGSAYGDGANTGDAGPGPDGGHPVDSGSGNDTGLPTVDSGGDDAGSDSGSDGGGNDSGSVCAQPFNGVLATWDFTGETGSQASTAAKSSAPGVGAGAISRVGVNPNAGANSINSNSWSLSSSPDKTKYYTFTIKPPSQCALDVTSIAIDTKSSNTGPASAAAATSDDGFNQTSNVPTNASSSVSLAVSGSIGAVEIRVYGYGATSSAGTMRIQNTLTVSGAVK